MDWMGAITIEAKKAIEELRDKGYNVALYTFPTIVPIDKNTIIDCAHKYDFILTVEEHQVMGGFASTIADVLSEDKEKHAILVRIGMQNVYTSAVGSTDYLRKVYKMDSKSIAETFLENKLCQI